MSSAVFLSSSTNTATRFLSASRCSSSISARRLSPTFAPFSVAVLNTVRKRRAASSVRPSRHKHHALLNSAMSYSSLCLYCRTFSYSSYAAW